MRFFLFRSTFEDGYDLWVHNLKENTTKVLLKKVGAGALQPDILIYNEPESTLKGDDAQLKAAVNCLLRELPEKK